MSDRPERPEKPASAAEIAKWMEEDFDAALAEGIENADQPTDEDDSD